MNDVLSETVRARGHDNVVGEHESTFEITSDDWLTPAGDCILAVDADRTPADFDRDFVEACKRENAAITAQVTVRAMESGDNSESEYLYQHTVSGRGDPALTFKSDRSLVGRTSEYIDDRTVLVDADAAAADFDRDLVAVLSTGAPTTITLTVE